MAREHAKNLFSMWTDDDFCSQPLLDKLLYNVLLAQPAMNYAGVQPINLKRWRKALRDGDRMPTELEVKAALVRLHRRAYVFTDDDSGETLVRSLMRNDGVYRQPNVMLSALRSARAVESPVLAAVLLSELHRITLPEVQGESPSANRLRDNLKRLKADAVNHLATLSEGLSEPFAEPFADDFPKGIPKDLAEGFQEGFLRPAEIEPFREGFPEGFREGFGEPPVVVGVGVVKSPTVGGYVGGDARAREATDQIQPTPDSNGPPPKTCPNHPTGTAADCGACGAHRRRRDQWLAEQTELAAKRRTRFRAAVRACPDCDDNGLIDEGNHARRCPNHDWETADV